MENVVHRVDGDVLTVSLAGRVDATNAQDVEEAVLAAMQAESWKKLILDCEDLNYLSSAGIRMVLRVAKLADEFSMEGVSSEVYEVLDMTGITEMLEVVKAYRRISVDGCPVIGEGANGIVYRIDPETICKVYRNSDALPEIHRERELSRTAFVAGIPTAIPYDVVRVDDGYGSVFELLDADSMAELIISGEWSVERVAEASAKLLRQMSAIELNADIIPPARVEAYGWIEGIAPVMNDADIEKIRGMVDALPDDRFMVHGDFHVKNVMVQNGEPILIDLDTLSYGNAIFDLSATYNTYVGRGLVYPERTEAFLGMPYTTATELWKHIRDNYFEDTPAEEAAAAQDKIRLLSSVRLMSWPLRHNAPQEDIDKCVSIYKAEIDEVLPRLDTLAL